jgi:hypothetical protein
MRGAAQKMLRLPCGVVTLDQETCKVHRHAGDAWFSIIEVLLPAVHDGSHHLLVGSEIIK